MLGASAQSIFDSQNFMKYSTTTQKKLLDEAATLPCQINSYTVTSIFPAVFISGRTITSSDDIEDIKLTKYDQPSGDITDTDSGHKAAATLANHGDANEIRSRDLQSKPNASIPSDAANERNDSVSRLNSPCPAISANETSRNNSNSDSLLCLRTAQYTAHIWCISTALQDPSNFCTGLFFDAAISGGGGKSSNSYTEEDAIKSAPRPYDVLQPCYRIVETSIHLCSKCASLFDSSLIVSDSINLSVFTCMSEEAIRIGLAYPGAAETLIRSSLLFACNTSSPVVLHTERALMRSALKHQVSSRNSYARLSRQSPKIIWRKKESENRFRSQLLSGCVTVTRFEDQERLRKALLAIDFDKIRAYSKEIMGQRGSEGEVDTCYARKYCVAYSSCFFCFFISLFLLLLSLFRFLPFYFDFFLTQLSDVTDCTNVDCA